MENAALILVVEDELIIRELLSAALEEDGYKILLAETAKGAIALLDTHKDVRGLVTDIRLGAKHELLGWDVARHARQVNPDIAVVYMTGDSGADWKAQGVPKSVIVVKPFAMSQISIAVAQLLNESG